MSFEGYLIQAVAELAEGVKHTAEKYRFFVHSATIFDGFLLLNYLWPLIKKTSKACIGLIPAEN